MERKEKIAHLPCHQKTAAAQSHPTTLSDTMSARKEEEEEEEEEEEKRGRKRTRDEGRK